MLDKVIENNMCKGPTQTNERITTVHKRTRRKCLNGVSYLYYAVVSEMLENIVMIYLYPYLPLQFYECVVIHVDE
jgi:hypothetical protein